MIIFKQYKKERILMTTAHAQRVYRADHVGSLLRSEKIKEARRLHESGELRADRLRQVEDEEIARIVQKQKDIGLAAVTDGEFRSGRWHFDFLARLLGAAG